MMSWIKQLQAYQGGWGRLVVLLAGELLDCLTDMLQALCKWASNNLLYVLPESQCLCLRKT